MSDERTSGLAVKRPWSAEEDEALIVAVHKYGTTRWTVIATHLASGRVGKQCRERWNNHLCPEVKKCEWSDEEDQAILRGVAEVGTRWCEIIKAPVLVGRTDNAIKNRFFSLQRRSKARFAAGAMRLKPPDEMPGTSRRRPNMEALAAEVKSRAQKLAAELVRSRDDAVRDELILRLTALLHAGDGDGKEESEELRRRGDESASRGAQPIARGSVGSTLAMAESLLLDAEVAHRAALDEYGAWRSGKGEEEPCVGATAAVATERSLLSVFEESLSDHSASTSSECASPIVSPELSLQMRVSLGVSKLDSIKRFYARPELPSDGGECSPVTPCARSGAPSGRLYRPQRRAGAKAPRLSALPCLEASAEPVYNELEEPEMGSEIDSLGSIGPQTRFLAAAPDAGSPEGRSASPRLCTHSEMQTDVVLAIRPGSESPLGPDSQHMLRTAAASAAARADTELQAERASKMCLGGRHAFGAALTPLILPMRVGPRPHLKRPRTDNSATLEVHSSGSGAPIGTKEPDGAAFDPPQEATGVLASLSTGTKVPGKIEAPLSLRISAAIIEEDMDAADPLGEFASPLDTVSVGCFTDLFLETPVSPSLALDAPWGLSYAGLVEIAAEMEEAEAAKEVGVAPQPGAEQLSVSAVNYHSVRRSGTDS
mmetsp:Transcript_17332/g.48306  ORF Transcript_17332/g.48306 Transcript_17332/m.48306 type:complete len:656 (-) Transcript_17332:1903-3870(-)